MKNIDKYLSLLSGEVDGLLLTSRYSRHYGAEFDIAEGVAIVSRKGCRYFTDSRYIESAQKNIRDFEVLDVQGARNYAKCINEAIADFGKPCRLRVFGDEFSVQNGYTETKVAMLKEPTPTAIFALSNTILLGAVKALNEQGIRVPEDISLVSFDDNIYLDYLNPPVTRIAQPTENMGVAAIKLLVTCIKEGKQLSSKIFMAPTIVSRDSVKILNARIDIADQEIEIEEEKED